MHFVLPVLSESGESGLDSVGEGIPTPRLFLLLLRQLFNKREKTKSQSPSTRNTRHYSASLFTLYENDSVLVCISGDCDRTRGEQKKKHS